MRISIIIPNYNHESYLQKRIDSVINQTFQDFEVIILDDCSTDNSSEIIKEFALNPFVSHLIFNDTNSNSVFKQWEKGVLLAKGEWIWMAESDDYAHPDFLAKCVKKISSCPDAGICFVVSQPIDENNNELPIAIMETPFDKYVNIQQSADYCIPGKEEIKNGMLFKNTLPNASAVIFKKELFLSQLKRTIQYKYISDW